MMANRVEQPIKEVLWQAWLVICDHEPDRLDPSSSEAGQARCSPGQWAPR
jgi:hypothetical protein